MILTDDFFQFFRSEASIDIDGDVRSGAQGFYTFFRNGIGDEDAVITHRGGESVDEKRVACKWK
jgi:hypothetical protein